MYYRVGPYMCKMDPVMLHRTYQQRKHLPCNCVQLTNSCVGVTAKREVLLIERKLAQHSANDQSNTFMLVLPCNMIWRSKSFDMSHG